MDLSSPGEAMPLRREDPERGREVSPDFPKKQELIQRHPEGWLDPHYKPLKNFPEIDGTEFEHSLGKDHSLKLWNEYIRIDPKIFKETLLKDLGVGKNPTLSFSFGLNSMTFSLNMDLPEKGSFFVERKIDFSKGKIIFHKNFSIKTNQDEKNPLWQGQGLAKTFIRNSLELYDHWGIKEIKVEAGGEIGRFVWAKFGFHPENLEDWKLLRSKIKNFFEKNWRKKLKRAKEDTLIQTVDNLLADDDPRTVKDIANLTYPISKNRSRTLTLGEVLLVGNRSKPVSWILDLTNPDEYDSLRRYVGGGVRNGS